jgi:hypothetical protein
MWTCYGDAMNHYLLASVVVWVGLAYNLAAFGLIKSTTGPVTHRKSWCKGYVSMCPFSLIGWVICVVLLADMWIP